MTAKTLTPEEIYRLSTRQERRASLMYKRLQDDAKASGVMGETALLEASEVIAILAARNKRLGLIE
jgi:hypothetical protein